MTKYMKKKKSGSTLKVKVPSKLKTFFQFKRKRKIDRMGE